MVCAQRPGSRGVLGEQTFRRRQERGYQPSRLRDLVRAGLVVVLLALVAAAPASAQGNTSVRGDTDCDALRTAADVVAAAVALGGSSACDNDDCDRGGTTTAADVDCSVGCLFGTCPIPPHAPLIEAAAPDSAPQITPFSTVRLTGIRFGAAEDLKRVLIGGEEAEIVEFIPPDSIVVVVPAVPPGTVDATFVDGDLGGFPFPLTIAPAAPIGEPDTFESTFALLDEAFRKLSADDLTGVFGDDTALVAAQLESARVDVAADVAAVLADPSFTTEARAAFDAAIDASGAAEQLRDLIDDLDSAGSEGTGAQTAPLVNKWGRTARVAVGVARAAATGIGSVPPVAIAIGVGTAIIGAVLIGANDPLTPLIFKIQFFDSQGRSRRFPTGGGTVRVEGARFDSISTRLQFAFPAFTSFQSITVGGDGAATVTLPVSPYACGPVKFALLRTAFSVSSNVVATRVQPELVDIDLTPRTPGEQFRLLTRGIGLCGGRALFMSTAPGGRPSALDPLPEYANDFSFPYVPSLVPGFYDVSVGSGPLQSDEQRLLRINSLITGLRISCDVTNLKITSTGQYTFCGLMLQPENVSLPVGASIQWSSSDPAVLALSTNNREDASFVAKLPGSAVVTASFRIVDRTLTSNAVSVSVVDEQPPSVEISAGANVDAGSTMLVTVSAQDGAVVTRLLLTATGDAVDSVQPAESPCLAAEQTCSNEFTLKAKDMGFQQNQITLTAHAFDGSGNEGTSSATVTVRPPDMTPPVVQIQSPQNGGRVRAGDTVQISVRLTDNQQNDRGVTAVKVEATGAAVASGPTPPELDLPVALPEATRVTSFTVRSAAELTNITERTITIRAEGTDASGNTAMHQITVMAGGPPSISAVVPSPVNGGESITITGTAFGDVQGSSTVTIGGMTANVFSWSNTSIGAVVPEDLSGMVTVVVTVDGAASNAFPLTVLGSGDVQITLRWSNTNDLDLHVIDPNGDEISYVTRQSPSGGMLDVDANASCSSATSSPRENIFWPLGSAPAGSYTVRVVFFKSCSDPATSSTFTVETRIDGVFATLIDNETIAGGSIERTFSH